MDKLSSFSRRLTPILIVTVLLFAGLVTIVSISAYNNEQDAVENYTQMRMNSLILDLETKLVSVESTLASESHGDHFGLCDSTLLFRRMALMLEDQTFIRHVGIDVWEEGMPTESSVTLYVSRLPDGSFERQSIYNDFSEFPDSLMTYFNKAYDNEGVPIWSLPYPDTRFAKATVVSCYFKVKGDEAVYCADVELDKLLSTIDSLQFYPNSKMFIDVDEEDQAYTLMNGELVQTDDVEYDSRHFTPIIAHYDRLNLDIINLVPKEIAYNSLMKRIIIVILLFSLALIILSIFVHRAFVKAQDSLAKSIEKTHREEMALKRIEDEIAVAARIQTRMLRDPGRPMHLEMEGGKPVDLMTQIIPAREVGGDLYEYRRSGKDLVVCIGDVSGKGIPASIVMSKCSTLFNAYVTEVPDPDPSRLLSYMNKNLCRRNDDLMFVTMWVGVLDTVTGGLKYASAGHNPPVLRHGTSARFIEMSQGVPLGMFEDADFPDLELTLEPDDSLLLYTDGITEAENPQHVLFGDERLLAVCSETGTACPGGICRSVIQAVETHTAGCSQSDDITLLCFTYAGTYILMHGIEDIGAISRLTAGSARPDEAALVLDEAATNAFTHGGAKFVCVTESGGGFVLVEDGDDFDPTAYVVPEVPEGELTIGGRGIPLIRSFCSEVGYSRTADGLSVHTFKLN